MPRIEQIAHDDKLVWLYMGFISYMVLILKPIFLTLVKLRQNLQAQVLAHTFNISKSLVSKYIITWITFMYHHLKEIEWMASTEQVMSTIP